LDAVIIIPVTNRLADTCLKKKLSKAKELDYNKGFEIRDRKLSSICQMCYVE
jgi:hypothetical protein